MRITFAELTEHNHRLQRAVSRLEELDRLKSNFLATMSHELRTPLTSVIGFSTLLQAREGLGPVERRFADRINLAGKALLSVINDILDFSKLEAGGVTLDIQPFEPRRVISESIEIVLAQIEQKGLWYACEIAPTVPARFEGDPARMRQILLNLLGNAIKFTDQGGVSVTVTAKPADAPGVAIVRISVTDTGIGIEPAAAAQLFERFTQVDETSARRHGGSGLGLAISRQLVELMNGRIGVDSQPGQGSTFWIEAPLAVAE
jgi:signal transduction histidine kinase